MCKELCRVKSETEFPRLLKLADHVNISLACTLNTIRSYVEDLGLYVELLHGVAHHPDDPNLIRCTCNNPDCNSPGKHPLYKRAHQEVRPTLARLIQQVENNGYNRPRLDWGEPVNVGMRVGWSGLVALDIDPR